MFNKIFLALFGIAVLVMAVITLLAYSQLQSIGFAPPQIVQNFLSYDNLLKAVLWISSLILLILANVILWTTRKGWALWLAFAYFAVFIMLDMWWLSESLAAYNAQNGLSDGSFRIGGLLGAALVVVAGLAIFFNQFLVLRMLDKMYPPLTETTPPVTVEKSVEAGRETPADRESAPAGDDQPETEAN